MAVWGSQTWPAGLQVVHPLLSFDPVRVEAAESGTGVKMSCSAINLGAFACMQCADQVKDEVVWPESV